MNLIPDDLYFSWANWVRGKVAAAGDFIPVVAYRDALPSPPYLSLEMGPAITRSEWLQQVVVLARIVVKKDTKEHIEVTALKYLRQFLGCVQDPGHIPKYRFEGASKVEAGCMQVKLGDITADLSGDPEFSERVLRFELS